MTCNTCKWWGKQPLPNAKYPDIKEHLCLLSKFVIFNAYGQDGKAIITTEEFGCLHHEKEEDR